MQIFEKKTQKIRRIPYGKSDFEAVNKQQDYYVDKTHFIEKLELTPFVFLIRPRRFGKSLLLSVLNTYYDINKKDRFEEFYQNTHILKNPTEERGKYMVLSLNFSGIIKDKDLVQEDFNEYCVDKIDKFVDYYKKHLPQRLIEKINTKDTAHKKLKLLSTELENHDTKIYLMIDEYDNFTNTLLAEYGESEYKNIARGAGYFKSFFEVLKFAATGSGAGLARMFITGVSPVTMDDVTSGFNIGDNISTDAMYNNIVGFTHEDVSEIIDYYASVGVFNLNKKDTLKIMSKWFNNYRFSKNSEESLYNTDAILYFMKRAYHSTTMPDNLIDPNLQIDYGKLRHLITIDGKLNGNFDKFKEILENGGISSNINTSFPYEKLTERENFVSLLYFFGLLTFTGKEKEGFPFLEIPNEAMKKQTYEYIRSSYDDVNAFNVDVFKLKSLCQEMAYRGNFKPIFNFIADEIKTQTKIRDFIQGEKVVQTFFLAYLNIIDFYISLSEEEMNKGFADLVMKPFHLKYRDIKYAYLLELKYIARQKSKQQQGDKTETKETQKTAKEKLQNLIDEKIKDSKEQLDKYQNDDFAKKMMHTQPYGDVILKKGIIIFHGWELVHIEEYNQQNITN